MTVGPLGVIETAYIPHNHTLTIYYSAFQTFRQSTYSLRAATNESQKTLNKCETRNKTVFHTRLRHPETINSVPLNSVLRIKQIGV